MLIDGQDVCPWCGGACEALDPDKEAESQRRDRVMADWFLAYKTQTAAQDASRLAQWQAMSRAAFSEPAAPIPVGDRFALNVPECADPSPFGGYSCDRRAAHTGNHVAPNGSNGTVGFVAWLDGEQWLPGHPESIRRAPAPGPVGDPLSWFQEQRNSLTRHEYGGAEVGPLPFQGMRICPRCGDKRCPRAWGLTRDCANIPSAETSPVADVVSLAEYRGRP